MRHFAALVLFIMVAAFSAFSDVDRLLDVSMPARDLAAAAKQFEAPVLQPFHQTWNQSCLQ